MPHPSCSLLLWIKLTMGQLLLFFLCNVSSFFSYVGGIRVTNHFSLFDRYIWLIDRYILAIQQIITHKEHVRSSELPQRPWHHNDKKWLKQPQSHFYWAIPNKSFHFSMFSCMLCTATPGISSSRENINTTTRVSRLSFRFLWLWYKLFMSFNSDVP